MQYRVKLQRTAVLKAPGSRAIQPRSPEKAAPSLPSLKADADNTIPPENDLALGCHGHGTYEDKPNTRCLKVPHCSAQPLSFA